MPPVQLRAPFAGTVAEVIGRAGERVRAGAPVLVLEAMKMEHELLAAADGVLAGVEVEVGQQVGEGQLLAILDPAPGAGTVAGEPIAPERPDRAPERTDHAAEQTDHAAEQTDHAAEQTDHAAERTDHAAERPEERPDLAEVRARHAQGLDAARPEVVAARHARGRRTARENIADLLDPGSLVEYGPLVHAAQERRRDLRELLQRTPADGLVSGVGRIEGSPCVAMSYDYTVLAGTQGMRNHLKKDRLFELAERRRLPVVLFAEGGGGRPGDVDMPIISGLDCRAFALFARLSGLVPLVGIASGYCFAGNAALLGCCDVVIATEQTSIGMGGPAMIEGAGLGTIAPERVGPIDVQHANGVVDLRVADDAAAVSAAKRYLRYFNEPCADAGEHADQALLRSLIPSNRKRAYDVRSLLRTLFDADSLLELRDGFAPGMVTALARVEGRALGVIANDPRHLGGAIDADGADKAARFMALCDAFELPIAFLCDTPGFMVGPDAERTATVRHFARMFLVGANLHVATGTVVLRKGYGLGAQAMAAGSFKAPQFTVAWPTSEFGAMGLEGAVRLGMRRELEAIADDGERERAYEQAVAAAYERGRGVNLASYFELDDVIDPAETRRWLMTLFDGAPANRRRRSEKWRVNLDAW